LRGPHSTFHAAAVRVADEQFAVCAVRRWCARAPAAQNLGEFARARFDPYESVRFGDGSKAAHGWAVATNPRYLPTAALAALCLFGSIAHAQEAEVAADEPRPLAAGLQLSLKLEPGLAAALSDPQSDRTELGVGTTAKLLFGVNRYLQLGPSIAFTTLPATAEMTQSGRAWTFGAGGRLMRPHDAPGHGISPWIDADLVYARTGDLSRPGFAAAVGVSMPLDDRRQFWVGPFARYFQILEGERAGYDSRDAKIIMFGVGLEVTTGLERRRDRIAAVVAPPPAAPSAP